MRLGISHQKNILAENVSERPKVRIVQALHVVVVKIHTQKIDSEIKIYKVIQFWTPRPFFQYLSKAFEYCQFYQMKFTVASKFKEKAVGPNRS